MVRNQQVRSILTLLNSLGTNTLGALHELRQMQKQHEELRAELNEIDRELNNMTVNKDKYQTLKQEVDLKSHEINLLTQRIERTPFFQLQEKVAKWMP